MTGLNFLPLLATLISVSVVAAEETPTCPIKGQIYYPVCAPGNLTCENPNQTYPYSCAPGCRCPYGQVLKDGKECVNKTECQPACPIKGQIHYPECAPCDGTCENPNPVCSKICEPGCACPKGQVIKDGRECVNKTECPPPECPFKGQIYYPECAPCDATCENPIGKCPPVCKPGCGCPIGQLVKYQTWCVKPKNCWEKACPIRGQIYYAHECAPCDGTCENPNPVCPAICKPGCACPRGKVIKNGKKCVKPEKCKK